MNADPKPATTTINLGTSLDAAKRQIVDETVKWTGNITKAAILLGINRRTIQRIMRQQGRRYG